MRNVYEILRERLSAMIERNGLGSEPLEVRARALTPREAIGKPESDDYAILKGKERMMAARFRGAEGHAFTDMFGNYTGTVADALKMELSNNYRRAVFVATLNAVTRFLGVAGRTMHCRDEGPVECSARLPGFLMKLGAPRRVAMVGLQPRLLEALAAAAEVRVTDMDPDNIGRLPSGVPVEGPEATRRNLEWCETAFVTGTTVVNGTIERFLNIGKPTVFYGVSISGAAALLGLDRFCPFGR